MNIQSTPTRMQTNIHEVKMYNDVCIVYTQACMSHKHACAHKHACTHTHTCTHKYMHTQVCASHKYMHTGMHVHTHIQTYMHTCKRTRTHTRTHARSHSRIHIHTRTRTFVCIRSVASLTQACRSQSDQALVVARPHFRQHGEARS
jgi:hypothetical protein